jgi:hypothetical protein
VLPTTCRSLPVGPPSDDPPLDDPLLEPPLLEDAPLPLEEPLDEVEDPPLLVELVEPEPEEEAEPEEEVEPDEVEPDAEPEEDPLEDPVLDPPSAGRATPESPAPHADAARPRQDARRAALFMAR